MLDNHKMRINARFRIAIIDCATSEVLANKYIMVSEKMTSLVKPTCLWLVIFSTTIYTTTVVTLKYYS